MAPRRAAGRALAGAAGAERGAQFLGLGLVAVLGERLRLGLGRGDQFLGGGVAARRRGGVTCQAQRPLAALAGIVDRWPADGRGRRGRR